MASAFDDPRCCDTCEYYARGFVKLYNEARHAWWEYEGLCAVRPRVFGDNELFGKESTDYCVLFEWKEGCA